MMHIETLRIPTERVGVIIGRNGRVKKRIESLTNVILEIDHEGLVIIRSPPDTEDPVLLWKARDIVHAIGRGFSPHNALTLIDEDARLVVMSLKENAGSSPSHIKRISGRLIGERGRARRVIEEITGVKVSVYGHTASIIGVDPGLEYATRAIEMLIQGAPHPAVYGYLEKMRREITRASVELWEQ
ncbi:MAG: RNA-processing protein [Candidatus Thorarchaeota archaeon]|nr:RNA-processing protein [Candidatus Thorarchaeota archaeon]